ncbi:MAG: glutathione S-transferase family protein [Cyanobacteria bacterium SBLK]|nr:glutathione S-transferase family protein [Cyanobacteria bacterium SBLK]
MTELELYSAKVCPFAHRTRLVLLEKGLEFSLKEIDLANKPADFSRISPYEKVPVLIYGKDRVWESAIINEYLEETFRDPPLLPQKPGEKAIARIWIDFANTKLIPAFYKLLLTQNPDKQQHWKQEVLDRLQFMETEGIGKLGGNGEYWLGEFSLVDISFYPWFERWIVLQEYRGLQFPATCPHLDRWRGKMKERESVKAIANSNTLYLQDYKKYAEGTAMGITAREMRGD